MPTGTGFQCIAGGWKSPWAHSDTVWEVGTSVHRKGLTKHVWLVQGQLEIPTYSPSCPLNPALCCLLHGVILSFNKPHWE